MAEIIKTFKEEIPAMRFFKQVKPTVRKPLAPHRSKIRIFLTDKTMGDVDKITAIWENGGGYVGLERRADGQPFEYWIGMFTPANTPVPEGFAYVDFSEVNLGTCWIYGKESKVHNTSGCKSAVTNIGLTLWSDDNGGVWSFENCTCPRYTTPDDQGNIIMDYCFIVK